MRKVKKKSTADWDFSLDIRRFLPKEEPRITGFGPSSLLQLYYRFRVSQGFSFLQGYLSHLKELFLGHKTLRKGFLEKLLFEMTIFNFILGFLNIKMGDLPLF